MKETWKHLEGEDADYETSNLGKIRNIKTQTIKPTSFIKKGSYEVCSLSADSYLVHRLVAKFIKLTTAATIQGRLKRHVEFKVLGYTLRHIDCALN